ncbi:MerR family transcriptional regulator [Microbacterium sp. HD4P20]|uniref:HEAT repeat domain-containing protein n=1 Tax=Microbacterium sp. HD4P20 TaxID=2864874 RepID=UPI001C642C48|nr:HEAT repeat domain-containing protein [Microbacterium sp. HD4P20]MCP2635621.1 MerR family transcriptional regulator [Microbacterium sp. HD4P20]
MLIGEVARRSGVSARMLRHYDRIGLVSPSARTAGDYRQYTDADMQRLFHVESLRSLGFSLSEIATTLDTADFAPGELVERLTERARAQLDATVELLSRLERVRASEPDRWSDVLRIVELIRGFDSSSASDRQRLALSLHTVDESNSAVLVEALLRENEPNAAGALVWSIARMGDTAVPALTEALNSDSRQRRHRALEALLKMGTPGSLAVVAAQTAHADGHVRARASITAGMNGDDGAIPSLIALVTAGELDIEAGDALEILAEDEQIATRIARLARGAMSATNTDGRRRLAGMLSSIPGAEADVTLELLAADTDSGVAMAARAHLQARSPA